MTTRRFGACGEARMHDMNMNMCGVARECDVLSSRERFLITWHSMFDSVMRLSIESEHVHALFSYV